jgi:hypothetical protein
MLPMTGELPGSDLVPVAGGQAAQAPARVAADYLGSLVTGRKLRLGARTSPMAVAQAEHVAGLLTALVPGLSLPPRTSGRATWLRSAARGRLPRRSTAPC